MEDDWWNDNMHSCSLVGTMTMILYLYLPETEVRTLRDIELHFSRVRKIWRSAGVYKHTESDGVRTKSLMKCFRDCAVSWVTKSCDVSKVGLRMKDAWWNDTVLKIHMVISEKLKYKRMRANAKGVVSESKMHCDKEKNEKFTINFVMNKTIYLKIVT